MLEITQEDAINRVNNGQAGFYCKDCHAPIPHPRCYCVFADHRWFLLGSHEISIKDTGIQVLKDNPGAWFRQHEVTVADDKHPIVALLHKDIGQAVKQPVTFVTRTK